MWKRISGSVQGTSHVQLGIPCQDYCTVTISGDTLIAACADGAGSAEFSQFGSKAAVDRFMEVASGDGPPTKDQVEGWVHSARERLLEEAAAKGSTPRELACTFLAALVGDGWAAFAQVGDGVIVFRGREGFHLAFWPDVGEYANTTRFLSEDDYRQHLRVEIVDRQVFELAVLTDGLQMLALDIAGAKVHDRFFTPLFETLRNAADMADLQTSLLQFMDSKRVNERTADDKTLILATRLMADAPTELPDKTT